jgi:hypothetical protein
VASDAHECWPTHHTMVERLDRVTIGEALEKHSLGRSNQLVQNTLTPRANSLGFNGRN